MLSTPDMMSKQATGMSLWEAQRDNAVNQNSAALPCEANSFENNILHRIIDMILTGT